MKTVQLWKWIGAKWKQKDTESENKVESQTEIVEKNELKSHIMNGGKNGSAVVSMPER